jgi:GNAT superfamily N-acetyltransferase
VDIRVDILSEADRPLLLQMLRSSWDYPDTALDLYRRPSSRTTVFVAWSDHEVVGMLSGGFDSDLAQGGGFDSFDLPPPPQALLDRIHVHENFRRTGVGTLLLRTYVEEATRRRCTFVGGQLDLSSDPTQRRRYFESRGFSVRNLDNFGARPDELLIW